MVRRSISGDRPRLPRIAIVLQDGDHADAVLRLVRELAGEDDLGDAVAIGVERGAVDHAAESAGDDVPLPGGILEPDQLRHAAGERDQVGLAVLVQVGDHHLVPAAQSGGDGMVGEPRGRRGGE